MKTIGSAEIKKVGLEVETIQNLLIDLRDTIQKLHGWCNTDARLTIFNKLSSVLTAHMLGLVFIERHLVKHEWWTNNSTIPFSDDQVTRVISEFEMSLRIGLIQNGFYAAESSLRIFTRSLDPDACGRAAAPSIYRWLFKRLDLEHLSPLFDLWRMIRNTMHNNGVFIPQNGRGVQIEYQGSSYSFEVGNRVSFVTTEFMVKMMANLVVAIAEIVRAQELARLPHCVEIG